MSHISVGKVSCLYGHCGLAEISVDPIYRPLALGVGLGVVVGGGSSFHIVRLVWASRLRGGFVFHTLSFVVRVGCWV